MTPFVIPCLYPDCPYTEAATDLEAGKQAMIRHINVEHAEAHVIIACACTDEARRPDVVMVEETVTETFRGADDVDITHTTERQVCTRCGSKFNHEVGVVEVESQPVEEPASAES